jgi:hypothetical protein
MDMKIDTAIVALLISGFVGFYAIISAGVKAGHVKDIEQQLLKQDVAYVKSAMERISSDLRELYGIVERRYGDRRGPQNRNREGDDHA